MQIIATKTPQGNYPDVSQVLNKLHAGLEIHRIPEICIANLHERLHLYVVTDDPENTLSALRDYLPEISPWFKQPVTNRQAIRQFLELYLGKDSSQAGEKSLQSDLIRDI
ncbi:MAG: hypothetical protein GWN00_30345, partial [Aliifodinibius sp.]|nr:hypothetical protein [Fodinibius sp.]NIY28931.1 hypothetical protein [Fodinibius sp.]